MRSEKRVSKRNVDALISTGGKAILWDAELKGFGVAASAGGSKSYILNWRAKDGRYRRLTLGQHGKITPEQARTLAKKRLGEIANGIDPLAEKRAQLKQVRTSFDIVAGEFIAKHVARQKSAHETERVIRLYLMSRFAKTPIAEIGRRDVAELLDDIESKEFRANGKMLGGPVQADRVLAALRKLFNWYAARDDEFRSPIVRGMSRTKPRERARDRVLTDAEIRAFWLATADLLAAEDVFSAIARTLLLTAQRLREVANMERRELGGLEWVVPLDRRKNGQANHLLLSASASRIIEAQPELGKFIFGTIEDVPFSGFSKAKARLDRLMLEKLEHEATRDGNRKLLADVNEIRQLMALANNDKAAAAQLKRRWWVTHDLRRTAKVLMLRGGIRPDITERVLGHIIPGVEGVYDRYDYREEKRLALEILARVVSDIVDPLFPKIATISRKAS